MALQSDADGLQQRRADETPTLHILRNHAADRYKTVDGTQPSRAV